MTRSGSSLIAAFLLSLALAAAGSFAGYLWSDIHCRRSAHRPADLTPTIHQLRALAREE